MAHLNFTNWIKQRRDTLGLLSEYLRVIIQQWNDILWLSVPAFPFVIWWFLGNPPVWIVAVVFVWVLVLAGYYAWRAERIRLIPQITLNEIVLQPTTTGDPTQNAIYAQVVPKCLSQASVGSCEGYLLRVMRWDKINGWMPTELNQPLRLKWSFYGSTLLTLHPGIDQRLNLFSVTNVHNVMRLETDPVPVAAFYLLRFQDRFRFDVRITSHDCPPADMSVFVHIGDRWDTPTVRNN